MGVGDKAGKYEEIEICRGIGILLVVLGHALKQTGRVNLFFDMMLSVIYSFHPVFCAVRFCVDKSAGFADTRGKVSLYQGKSGAPSGSLFCDRTDLYAAEIAAFQVCTAAL